MADLRDIIPGLADAENKERLIRESPFVVRTETVAGFELRPLTLCDYTALRLARSPFIFRDRMPAPIHCADFIWRMSPDFARGRNKDRKAIQKKCERFIISAKPLIHTRRAMARWERKKLMASTGLIECVVAINEFIAEAFLDRMDGKRTSSSPAPSYYCEPVQIVAELAREFGWSPETIMNLPVKAVLGFQREILRHHSPTAPMVNILSDRVKANWMQNVNARN